VHTKPVVIGIIYTSSIDPDCEIDTAHTQTLTKQPH